MITRNHVTSIHDYSVFKTWLPGYPSSYASRCQKNRAGEPNVRELYGQCMKEVQLPFTHIPLDMLSHIYCCHSVTKSCLTLQPYELQHTKLSCPHCLKFMTIELVMISNHFILCCPLLLLLSIFPSIRDFSKSWLFA